MGGVATSSWASGENQGTERIEKILAELDAAYPDARLLLDFGNPFELLCAAILAARATDEKVNEVTPELFRRFPEPADLAAADLAEVEEIVHPTGFFRQKAKRLVGVSRGLVERFDGRVPETVDELTTLPGVGKKTAILVVNHGFDEPAGVVVDTHVQRIAHRLDWSHQKNAEKVETELEELLPRQRWISLQDLLAFHGRACCKAPKPRCSGCPVEELCYFPDKVFE
jgi:endonuclease-3